MKHLGVKATIRAHELELIESAAKCAAYGKDEVKALYQKIMDQVTLVRSEKAKYEDIETELRVANAMLSVTDKKRDDMLVKIGRIADIQSDGTRDMIFDLFPSKIANLSYDKESDAIRTIIEKMRALPEDSDLRSIYEPEIVAAEEAFKGALTDKENISTKLSVARVKLVNFKLQNDKFREGIYASLITLVGQKTANFLI